MLEAGPRPHGSLKAVGERIASRDPDRQAAGILTRIALMTRFCALGRTAIMRVA
jgi:hypothetical protein